MKRTWVTFGVLLSAMAVTVASFPAAASSTTYRGAATTVVKEAGESPLVDRGIVICRSTGPSIGGGCLQFDASGDSVRVTDARLGTAVAFQVCIDNNGDGLCGGTPRGDPCGDDLFFSHDDSENFFNPLGPLPQGFRTGCSGGWPGYVVFLCQGVHFPRDRGAPHVHTPSTGTIDTTVGGTGFGDFCQAENDLPPKQYLLR